MYKCCFSDWTAVKLGVKIPWDLEGKHLQIKTDSTLGSNESISIILYDKDSSWISNVSVNFSSTVQYDIEHCTYNRTDLPGQPPVGLEKIWTFNKTKTALIITCNNVEVLNYLFADSSESCFNELGTGDVEKIQFGNDDDASNFYRAGKGSLNLMHTTANK